MTCLAKSRAIDSDLLPVPGCKAHTACLNPVDFSDVQYVIAVLPIRGQGALRRLNCIYR